MTIYVMCNRSAVVKMNLVSVVQCHCPVQSGDYSINIQLQPYMSVHS